MTEIINNPIYHLAYRVLRGERSLGRVLQDSALAQMSMEAVEELHRYIRQLLADLRRVTEAHVLAEINYKTAIQSLGDVPLTGHCAWMLSETLARRDNPRLARRRLILNKRALQLIGEDAELDTRARIISSLGDSYLALPDGDPLENLHQALACYQQALSVFTRDTFPAEFAMLQISIGNCYMRMPGEDRIGWLRKAIDVYQVAREVCATHEPPLQKTYAAACSTLAGAYTQLPFNRTSHLKKAIGVYEEALTAYTLPEMPVQYAMVKMNLGTVYLNLPAGDWVANVERAIIYLQEALAIFTLSDYPAHHAATQYNLGNAYGEMPDPGRVTWLQKAVAAYQAALSIRTPEATPLDHAQTQVGLGKAYFQLARTVRLAQRPDQLRSALAAFEKASAIYTQDAFPLEQALVQNNLGVVYLQLSQVAGSDESGWLHKAAASFQMAQGIFEREKYTFEAVTAQCNSGDVYARLVRIDAAGALQTAADIYTAAATTAVTESLPGLAQRAYQGLGDLYFQRQLWAEALTAYQEALAPGNRLIAAAYTEPGRQVQVSQTSQLYAQAAFCLWQQKQAVAALLQLERGKTRLLNHTLALDNSDLTRLPAEQRQQLSALRQRVRELDAERRLSPHATVRRSDVAIADQLRQTYGELDDLIQAVRNEQPDFMPTGLSLDQILALIPESGAMVMPLVTAQGSVAFVLPHGQKTVQAADVVPLYGLDQKTLHTWLTGSEDEPGWLPAYAVDSDAGAQDKRPAQLESLTQQLWQRLMGPIHKRLKALELNEGAPVVIVPQGGVGLLPLHAAERPVNGARRTFLDDYTVTYVPSAYVMQASRKRLFDKRRDERTLLAVVNPTRNLPYAALEGHAVMALFPVEGQRILLEEAATPTAVITEAPAYEYIHFACHGRYAWDDVMRSRVTLANDSAFTLADVIGRLDLRRSRLVVLSACETGLSELARLPDESIGLPTGFLQAGVPGVVTTLWQVPDLSTMLLMHSFYTAHFSGMAPVAALRQAQLWLRRLTAGELEIHFKEKRREHGPNYEQVSAAWRRFAAMEPDEKPFDDAYYWAAFTFTGA